jgi:enoyl-CoA hydratase
MGDLVSYERDGDVAVIGMDDGKANVMSPNMTAALGEAFDQAEGDGLGVLLTGRAGRFSAGFDLRVLTGGGEQAHLMVGQGFQLAARVFGFPAPVVVAVNGHALAMGAFLVMAADYRIGVRGDFKIGANEVSLGIPMPASATELLRYRLLPSEFNRSALLSEIYSPERAVAAGYLDDVVDAESLATTALETARRLAALPRPAFTATKARTRGAALAAVEAGVKVDDAEFRAILGL